MFKRFTSYFISFLLFISLAFAQENKEFIALKTDTDRVGYYLDYGKKIFQTSPDSALLLWQKGLTICQRNASNKQFLKKEALLNKAIGAYYQTKGQFNLAYSHYQKGLNTCLKNNLTDVALACYRNIGLLQENLKAPNCKTNCEMEGQKQAEITYRKALFFAINKKDKKEEASFYKSIAYVKINLNLLDSAEIYFKKAINIQYLIHETENLLSTYNDLIYVYQQKGETDKSLNTWKEFIICALKLKDEASVSEAYFNIGALYYDKGNIPAALENYFKALQVKEKNKDVSGKATLLNTLGILYKTQSDTKKAYDYHTQALSIYKNLNDEKGIAYTLNNIGNIYDEFGDESCKGNKKECLIRGQLKALDYYKQSLELLKKIGDSKGMGYALNNVGSIYSQLGDPNCKPIGSDACVKSGQQIALTYLLEGLKYKQEIGDKQGIAFSLNNIGSAYSKLGDAKKATRYLNEALSISNQLGFPENIRNSSELLYKVYKKEQNYCKALQMHELYMAMRDSINNSNTQKESVRKQFQYQYEKKATADSIKNEHEQSIKNAQIVAQNAKLKQEKTMRYALYGGLFLMILFAGFIFNRFKVTQKQKGIIEQQKTEVEKQKKEVEKQHEIAESRRIIAEDQKEVIEKQKHEVEEKQKEITDSIHYASRIQRAMLTSNTYITNVLGEQGSEHFLFYQPKDIVSGDFYWALSIPPVPGWDLHTSDIKFKNNETRSDIFYLCTADCTGHGVPGAFMSLLNIGFLNAVILEKYIKLPHEILDHQRKEIIKALNPTGTENSKDGMDCVLYCIDYNKMLLHVAAANNPLWLIRKLEEHELINKDEKIEHYNNYKLLEFKPNKMPVGLSGQEDKKFKGDIVEIKRGDLIYTFTDGFADQFGGEKGKKFMYKAFKQLLLANCEKSMETQKEILENTINNWMSEVDQIDDILVIGVKI